MNMNEVEQLARHPNMKWTLCLNEVAERVGCSRGYASEFLKAHSVPYYRLGKKKLYLIWEVLEALEKTRWKSRG